MGSLMNAVICVRKIASIIYLRSAFLNLFTNMELGLSSDNIRMIEMKRNFKALQRDISMYR